MMSVLPRCALLTQKFKFHFCCQGANRTRPRGTLCHVIDVSHSKHRPLAVKRHIVTRVLNGCACHVLSIAVGNDRHGANGSVGDS